MLFIKEPFSYFTPMFVSYPKIKNATGGLVSFAPPDEVWVALEKVHGANFGLNVARTDPERVVPQRRNASLGGDESFFGVGKSGLLATLKAATRALFALPELAAAQELTVFGELFGANVQTDIFYSPTLQFVAFDICVDGATMLAYDVMRALCTRVGLACVAPLKTAPLAEMAAAFDIERLASVFNVQATAEGVVLRPLSEPYTISQKARRIFKLKRAAFCEKRVKKAGADTSLVEEALDYVTPGRLMTTRSKLSEGADLPTTARALTEDALADFYAELSPAAGTVNTDAKRAIAKAVTTASFALVKKHSKDTAEQ
jgi:Rnl2 family RNA ligase